MTSEKFASREPKNDNFYVTSNLFGFLSDATLNRPLPDTCRENSTFLAFFQQQKFLFLFASLANQVNTLLNVGAFNKLYWRRDRNCKRSNHVRLDNCDCFAFFFRYPSNTTMFRVSSVRTVCVLFMTGVWACMQETSHSPCTTCFDFRLVKRNFFSLRLLNLNKVQFDTSPGCL